MVSPANLKKSTICFFTKISFVFHFAVPNRSLRKRHIVLLKKKKKFCPPRYRSNWGEKKKNTSRSLDIYFTLPVLPFCGAFKVLTIIFAVVAPVPEKSRISLCQA